MKTAAIYARYSSDNQTEQSIEGQLRVCEEYAQRNNILILNTYIDRAMTGTNDNRPDFQKMLKDSARREWDYILVYKLDRFSRNKYETAIHKKTLRDNGVRVISAMENIPDTPEGIILESLLEGMSQYYSAELSQKVKRGMRETRLKGNYQGGGVPYGYKVDGKKIVVDEFQAEVVKYMYEQYTKGVYVKDIIRALNAKGITYRGRQFQKSTVHNILKNDKYTGVYRHGDELVENMYPQIISPDLMAKAILIANRNKHGKRSVETVYLLRHKLKCGYCGSSISAETGTSQNGEVKRYYKCFGRKRKSGCKKSMVRKDELEKAVIDTTIKELSKPHIMSYITKFLLKYQESEIQLNSSLNMLIAEQRRTETAIQNVMTAIENGVFTSTTTKRLKELESRQEELEKQILIERSKTAVKLTERDIKEYFEQALKLEPQMLVNYLIKEVILFDDKIQIHYNSPIRMSPDHENGQGFIFNTKTVKILSFVNGNLYSYNIKVEMLI